MLQYRFLVVAVFSALLTLLGAVDQYSVPQPKIEVFHPKGLRISIPDEPGVTSVSFYLSFDHPVTDNDPGSVAKEVDDKQGTYWIYYNPSILLKARDMVHYRLAVHRNGLTWTRQGSEPVLQVVSLADNTVVSQAEDCEEGQQHLTAFPDVNQFAEPSETKTQSNNQIKSAYSMHKSMPLMMPSAVSRSSTTTTSGTFYVKPTGEVESSGYKAASSYDSSRREGEQWQHSKSELTEQEIEDLKRIHGHDFFTMPAYAHLHNGGTSGSYRQSSYSSAEALPSLRPTHGSGYSTYSKYEKHESTNSAPVISSPSTGSATYTSSSDSSYFQPPAAVVPIRPDIENLQLALKPAEFSSMQTKYHRKESTKSSSGPIVTYPTNSAPVISSPSTGSATYTSSSDSSYFQPPAAVVPIRPDIENLQLALKPAEFSSMQTKYHRKESTKSSSGPIVTYPTGGSSTKVTETYESTSPQKTVVPNPLTSSYSSSTSIFRSNVRPTSPYSCSSANYGFKRPDQVDVAVLDRTVQEMQCLAVLAEDTLRNEVKTLKEANYNLESRLTVLESQFQRFKANCQCGY